MPTNKRPPKASKAAPRKASTVETVLNSPAFTARRDLARNARSGNVEAARELLKLFASQPDRADTAGLVVRRYVTRCIRAFLRDGDIAKAFNLNRGKRGRPTKEAVQDHGKLLRFMAEKITDGLSPQAAANAAAEELPYTSRNAERIFKDSGSVGKALCVAARRRRAKNS
jgi:hypothetical protein